MIRKYGPAIVKSGYSVCALWPGEKRPMGRDWSHRALSAETCASFSPEDAGVGIICGLGEPAVYGIDADVQGDFAFADALRARIFEILGDETDQVYRIGAAPKFLIPVQGAAGFRKVTSPAFAKNGLRACLEFLGEGQQFVAEGIHPGTGCPYEWFGEPFVPEPGCHLPPTVALPTIDADKLKAIIDAFCGLARAHGWTPQEAQGRAINAIPFPDSPKGEDDFVEAADAELAGQRPMGLTIAQAREYLADFPGAADYATWLNVGMALHFEFSASPEALSLWDEWSAQAGNYRGLEDLRYRWSGFGRNTGFRKTMADVVKHYSETHYDDAGELSEIGRAYRFYEVNQGRLCYVADAAAWYQWKGVHWEPVYQEEVEGLVDEVLGKILRADLKKACEGKDEAFYRHAQRVYYKFRRAATAPVIVRAAARLPVFRKYLADFDADARYLGVANGDIDLTTGEFLAPDPARMISKFVPIVYDKGARCPLWERTISEAFASRPAYVEFLQRVFGYALMGNPREEKLFIFHGCGANGKSTIVNTIRQVFGGYAVTMQASTVTAIGRDNGTSAGGARADLVALMGKRLALVPETEDQASMREATVKRLVSLDAITARGVYARESVTFTPTAVPILVTNYMPEIRGTDEGIWRRVVAVSFTESFQGRADTNRQAELRTELPGIFNWVLEGALRYQREGLDLPKAVQDETAGLRGEMDVVQDWLSECCVFERGARLRTSEALASWEAWEKKNGYASKMTIRRFTSRLHDKGIQCARIMEGGKRFRIYEGIRLADEFENLEEK